MIFMGINIEDQYYEVQVTYKKIKNLILRVDGTTLRISAPKGTGEDRLLRFIREKEAWIARHAEGQLKKQRTDAERPDSDDIYWFGMRRRLIVSSGMKDSVTWDSGVVEVCLKECTEKRFQTVFRKAAVKALETEVQRIRPLLDRVICQRNRLPLPRIRYRHMTSRWGVCQTNRYVITLSSRLIHYPVECLAYVLLHEYAHLLVPNHSAAFYDIIRTYMPDYASAVNKLKNG